MPQGRTAMGTSRRRWYTDEGVLLLGGLVSLALALFGFSIAEALAPVIPLPVVRLATWSAAVALGIGVFRTAGNTLRDGSISAANARILIALASGLAIMIGSALTFFGVLGLLA